MFYVHLVHDAGSRGNDAEVGECSLSPAEELIAFFIPFVFNLNIFGEGIWGTEVFDDNGVIDHHLSGVERVDLVGVSSQRSDSLTHGGQVNNARNAGEVLHENACGGELYFYTGVCGGIPVGKSINMFFCYIGTVFVTKKILRQYL